jgi:hypothetical protein
MCRYIKELADRLNTLEGAMQAGEIPTFGALHHESISRRGSNEYSPPPNHEGTQQRKRTYSTISNEFSPAYQPQRPNVAWAAVDPPRHLPPPQSPYQMSPPVSSESAQPYRSQYSPNGIAPQPSWRNEPDLTIRPNTSFESVGQTEQLHPDHKIEWSNQIVDGYGPI